MNIDEATSNFRNLSLSYRGSERQPPNTLQLALRLSRVMEIRQAEGGHPADWSCEQRLRAVVDEFHMSAALPQRHRVDEDRFKSLVNLILGTSSASRDIISEHLNHAKWKESAFSVDQFRSTRWLLKTSPKLPACPMKKALTVSEESQKMHLQLVVAQFTQAGRRQRPSARARNRLSQEMFERYCDFACVYACVLEEARQLTSWTPEKEAEVLKIFMQKRLDGTNLEKYKLLVTRVVETICQGLLPRGRGSDQLEVEHLESATFEPLVGFHRDESYNCGGAGHGGNHRDGGCCTGREVPRGESQAGYRRCSDGFLQRPGSNLGEEDARRPSHA